MLHLFQEQIVFVPKSKLYFAVQNAQHFLGNFVFCVDQDQSITLITLA